jgi:hypothetical protein
MIPERQIRLYEDSNMRETVWSNYYGTESDAKCGCCGIETITKDNIKIFKKNDTQIPICKTCFRGVVSRNSDNLDLIDYSKKHFPATSLLANHIDNPLMSRTNDSSEDVVTKKNNFQIFTVENELLVNHILSLIECKQQIRDEFDYNRMYHNAKIFEYINILLDNKYVNGKQIIQFAKYFKLESNKHKCNVGYKKHLEKIAITLYKKIFDELNDYIDTYDMALICQELNEKDLAYNFYCESLENKSKYDNSQLSLIHYNIGKILLEKSGSNKTNIISNYKLALEYGFYGSTYSSIIDSLEIITYIINNDDYENVKSFCNDLINKSCYNVLHHIVDIFIKNNDIDESIKIVKKIYNKLTDNVLNHIYEKYMIHYTKNKKYVTSEELNFILLCFGSCSVTKYDVFLLKFSIINRVETIEFSLNNVKLIKTDNECLICCKTKSFNVTCCNSHNKKCKETKNKSKATITCGFTLCVDCYENLGKNSHSDSDSYFELETSKKCPQCRGKI